MLDVRPLRALRYDDRRVPLGRALCPPYDVIGDALARRLRRLPHNAIHIELPSGEPPARYRRAAAAWKAWRRSGILRLEERPAFFVVEQRFTLDGRAYRRVGLIAGLGLADAGPRRVRPHEKTLSKPKKDRLKLIAALQANTSPIFGLYSDPSGRVRRLLAGVLRRKAERSGTSEAGERFRVWKVDGPRETNALANAFKPKTLLIADGHHRFAVARAFAARRRSGAIMIYLCAEEDPGLLVLPTHRVLDPKAADEAAQRIQKLCSCVHKDSLKSLLAALRKNPSPYAFGVFNGRYTLAIPRSADGVRSRLSVEWLSKKVFKDLDPHAIRYTHDADEAAALVRREDGAALFIKPVGVADIRRAVDAVGLLPQKSTYFYPKIATGIAFNPLAP